MKELDTFLRNTIKYKDPHSAQYYYQLMTRIGQKSPQALQVLKKQKKLLQRAGCGASKLNRPGENISNGNTDASVSGKALINNNSQKFERLLQDDPILKKEPNLKKSLVNMYSQHLTPQSPNKTKLTNTQRFERLLQDDPILKKEPKLKNSLLKMYLEHVIPPPAPPMAQQMAQPMAQQMAQPMAQWNRGY